jgi:hypothetical protein
MLLTSNAYMERLCLEDVGLCNITSVTRKGNLPAVAHVLIAARHAVFYTESNGLPNWPATGCFIAIFGVFLVADKLQFSLCLIKYVTLRRVQEWKYISHIRQLGPTGRWVVSCTPQTLYPLDSCRRCPLDRRPSLLVWTLWTRICVTAANRTPSVCLLTRYHSQYRHTETAQRLTNSECVFKKKYLKS